MTPILGLRAFAKVNLGLRLVGKRPDGYHEIRTVYQSIGLHDRLELCLSETGITVVESNDPSLASGPHGEGNLVYTAAEVWRQARQFRGGVYVRLEKRIPVGSGLGGGSSDAAATLVGLERLTGDRLTTAAHFKLASRLGSDVPFFLVGGRAQGRGRGEKLRALSDLPPRDCLVIFPGEAMSTAEAYRQAGLELTRRREDVRIEEFGTRSHNPSEKWGPAENDFESVVFARWPRLAELKSQLIRAGAEIASLAGSGSAVFGVFSSAQATARAAQLVPREWTGWQVLRTQTVTRRQFLEGRLESRESPAGSD